MTESSVDLIALRASVPMTPEGTAAWAAKGTERAAELLRLAGPLADPAPVEPLLVTEPAHWPYGNFMVAWLDRDGPVRHVRHVPDAGFFLRLLGRAYAPVLDRRPDLVAVLHDDSRPEMSLTNDALQIQLDDGMGEDYSMVRNHALMLFVAALWLEAAQRSAWLDLYDAIVDHVDARPGGRPSLERLAAIEAGAFEDFVALAPQTLEPVAAEALLASSDLDRILEYQLLCAAAIGVLWRDYRAQGDDAARERWHRRHLSELYNTTDYLNDLWMERR